MTAADKYFLKAKDNYPYCLDDAIEALEYGLACDNEHPGLLTLHGTLYYRDLKQFEAARECYELALFYDQTYVDAWYAYISLATTLKEYRKVDKLVERALKIAGIDMARVMYLSAKSAELQGKQILALDMIKKARLQCTCNDCDQFLKEEIERLEGKVTDAKAQQMSVPPVVYSVVSTLAVANPLPVVCDESVL